MNDFVSNFLCKQDTIKKNKTPSTSKVKQKQVALENEKCILKKNFFYMGVV